MKKLKLVPSLILLALCVAVLGIGIYAASPASNQITGTVTVNAANPEVDIAVYNGSYNSESPATNRVSYTSTRTGSDTLSMGDIEFDASEANSPSDVPSQDILIVVHNNSTTANLGVYFWNRFTSASGTTLANVSGASAPTEAAITATSSAVTATDILYGDHTNHYVTSGTSPLNGILKVNYSFYQHLAPSQTIIMYARLSLNALTETLIDDAELNLYLNIEEYKASASQDAGFVKLPATTTSVAGSAFNDNLNLTNMVIPYGVTSIGASAFSRCSSLTSITIPSSVTSIGNSVFSDCTGLASMTVEAGNTVYDSRGGCNAIIKTSTNELIYGCKNTVIPSSVTRIGSQAFAGCSRLTSITIPSSVTRIGQAAFYGCSGLTSITIPSSVTRIFDSVFSECSSLTSITIPSSVISIGNAAFEGCSELTSITIPSSLTSMGFNAFYNCSGLTSITIPSSVTSIGNSAFYGCSGLTSITIPSSVTRIGSDVFVGCTGLTTVTFEVTTGWFTAHSDDATSGITIDVTNSTTNATNLKNEASWGGWRLIRSAA